MPPTLPDIWIIQCLLSICVLVVVSVIYWLIWRDNQGIRNQGIRNQSTKPIQVEEYTGQDRELVISCNTCRYHSFNWDSQCVAIVVAHNHQNVVDRDSYMVDTKQESQRNKKNSLFVTNNIMLHCT